MSFGFAVGDILAVSNFAWTLYRSCKGASEEFQEISREVITLHTGIKELEEDACNPDSLLNRVGKSRKSELETLLQSCMTVLRQLQRLVTRYQNLGTNHKRVWDRVKFGTEGIQNIREKLTFHAASITLFLTSLGTGALGGIERKLDELLMEIRDGKREPSILSLGEEEDETEQDSTWRLLKGDLADGGITEQELELHKSDILGHLRALVHNGELGEAVSKREKKLRTSAPSTASAPVCRPSPPLAETGHDQTDDDSSTSRTRIIRDGTIPHKENEEVGKQNNFTASSEPKEDIGHQELPPSATAKLSPEEKSYTPRIAYLSRSESVSSYSDISSIASNLSLAGNGSFPPLPPTKSSFPPSPASMAKPPERAGFQVSPTMSEDTLHLRDIEIWYVPMSPERSFDGNEIDQADSNVFRDGTAGPRSLKGNNFVPHATENNGLLSGRPRTSRKKASKRTSVSEDNLSRTLQLAAQKKHGTSTRWFYSIG